MLYDLLATSRLSPKEAVTNSSHSGPSPRAVNACVTKTGYQRPFTSPKDPGVLYPFLLGNLSLNNLPYVDLLLSDKKTGSLSTKAVGFSIRFSLRNPASPRLLPLLLSIKTGYKQYMGVYPYLHLLCSFLVLGLGRVGFWVGRSGWPVASVTVLL